MQSQWLNKKEGNQTLLLFFNGWGQDARAVEHLASDGTDVLMLYAYHRGETMLDPTVLRSYRAVDLVAWSMGVWYAHRQADRTEWNIRRAVAVCGTPFAIDDLRGIPRTVFDATLSALTPRTLEKFAMRMTGGVSAYRQSPLSAPGARSFDDVRDELQWWRDSYADRGDSPDALRWQKALIGTVDGIFPPENQQRAWQQAAVPVVFRDSPHYPFAGFDAWEQVLDIR